jgi:hypothetical protein
MERPSNEGDFVTSGVPEDSHIVRHDLDDSWLQLSPARRDVAVAKRTG